MKYVIGFFVVLGFSAFIWYSILITDSRDREVKFTNKCTENTGNVVMITRQKIGCLLDNKMIDTSVVLDR